MVSNSSPIFILGVPRSGTTLLSFILDSHPNIAVGRETLIMKGIQQILCDAKGNDDTTLLFRNWYQRYGLERPQFLEYIRNFLTEFFSDYARKCGKQRWGEKTPLHMHYVELIREIFPDAKLIHIIRDPRAVCASRKSWKGNVEEFAKEWQDQNIHVSDFGAQTGPRLFKKIRYEDLVLNPRLVLTDLMDYLEEPMTESLFHHENISSLRYIAAGREKGIDPLHDRIHDTKFVVEGGPQNDPRRTIDTNSFGLWTEKLKNFEIDIIQNIARKGMIRFGYTFVSGKKSIRKDAGLAWREYPDNTPERSANSSFNGKPDISIIMPTRNRAHFLDRAIQDVQKQNFHNWELIVIDDGSVDDTKEIAKKYLQDARILYVQQPHRGLSKSRNTGLRLARAKYLAFHDDDDLWLPGRLQSGYDWLQQNPRHAFVYSPVMTRTHKSAVIYPESIKESELVTLVNSCEIQVCSITVRNEVIQHIGFFNEKIEMCEDYDLWLRIASQYEYGCIPTIQAEYHLHSDNMTRSKYKLYQGLLNVLYDLRQTELTSVSDSIFHRRMSGLHLFLFRAALRERGFWKRWSHFSKCLLHFALAKWSFLSDLGSIFKVKRLRRILRKSFPNNMVGAQRLRSERSQQN